LKRLLAGRTTLILSAFSSRSFCLVGVAGRLRAAASDSLELSPVEDPLGGDGGPGGPWPPSEEDVSVSLGLLSSDDVVLDPKAKNHRKIRKARRLPDRPCGRTCLSSPFLSS